MQIILLQDVKSFGKKGEIKNAADGYALNFLLPKKLAVKATEQKIEILEKQLQKNEQVITKSTAENEAVIAKLKGVKLEFKDKVSAGGKLFAAINEKKIIAKLKQEKKIELKEKNIKLAKHLKDLGEHEVLIDVGDNLKTKIIVKIIEDK